MTLLEETAALKRFAARGRRHDDDVEDMRAFLRNGGRLLAEQLRCEGLVLPDPAVHYLLTEELGELYYRFRYEQRCFWRDKQTFMVEIVNPLDRILGSLFWDDMEHAFRAVFRRASNAGLTPEEGEYP